MAIKRGCQTVAKAPARFYTWSLLADLVSGGYKFTRGSLTPQQDSFRGWMRRATAQLDKDALLTDVVQSLDPRVAAGLELEFSDPDLPYRLT
jgi:hypothetical protein